MKRITQTRPVGAVVCEECETSKNSGKHVRIEDMGRMETETVLLCDMHVRELKSEAEESEEYWTGQP